MEISKRMWFTVIGFILAITVVIAGYLVYTHATHNRITAYFAASTSLYAGDPVRVLGVNVGRVVSIDPAADAVRVTMDVDKDVPIPADANALIVAQSLVSGRFIQLAPVYDSGPTMTDGTDIPMERTAVPMEWDDVKEQLAELTDAVGPDGPDRGAAADAVETFDDNLSGNGAAIRESIRQLSAVTGTLAAGRDDVFATIRSLQTLTDALSGSHEELVQFNGRIASVGQVLGDSTEALDGALSNLTAALGDVQEFIDRNGEAMTPAVQELADTTQILADKDEQLRGLLHSSPHQLANFYNIYNPMTGSLMGVFGLGMGSNLITLLCGTMQANDRPGMEPGEVEHCVDTLAPLLSTITMNYPPFLANPAATVGARPDQLSYQNDDVRQRAQQGIRDRDQESRRNNDAGPLTDLLVPWGAEG